MAFRPSQSLRQRSLRRLITHVRFLLPVVCLALAGSTPGAFAQSQSGFTYNGVVYTSYQASEYQQTPQGPQGAAAIRATGANYTSVLVTQYMQTYTSNTIAPETPSTAGYNNQKDPLSPTDAAVVAAIQNLQAQGLTVVLKPQVDSLDGIFRADFAPTDPAAWFASYQTFILHYAQLASQNGVGNLIIGTELASLSKAAYETYWDNIIAQIRASYPSLTLIYGANATGPTDEFTTVSFWDKVDVIGVDGYFPLTNHVDPTVAELVAAWTDNKSGFNIVAALKTLQSQYNKPLIFTEIGYVSAAGTNEAPYNLAPAGATYDPTEQEDCYEAFFEVFSQQTAWMKGVFWWAWSVSPPATGDVEYTPQNKPAGTVTLPKWFGSTTAGFTLTASNSALTLSQGLTATDTISVTNLGGFSGAVTLAASNLPSGVSASFAAGTGAGTQVLTLTATSAATAGPITITVTGTSGSLTASTQVALVVQGATSQTITFNNPGAQSVGSPLNLTATASSGLPVSFDSSTLGVCTVSGTTATFVSGGTCTITASQAGNSIYSAASPVAQSFTVTALAPVPVPAADDVIVSQVNWLNSLGGYAFTSGNPAGSSFAVNSNGDVVVANTNDLVLFNSQTGAQTTLGAWQSASAVAVDSHNNLYVGNLYGPLNIIVKLPYVGGTSNGGYAPFTTPTASTPTCTSSSTSECALAGVGSVNPGALLFDPAGDLFWVSAGSGTTSGNGIYECTVACLGGTGAPVQIYGEPTASTAPSTASGQLLIGSIAIDPAGNLFFTDSSIYVSPSYAITSFYSDLNELSTSKGAGFGGVTTGYAASPSVLYSLTPSPVGTFDDQIDAVAVNSTTGTVYFAAQNDGVFAFPNSGTPIPVANGQPTAMYTASAQGAKTLTLDGSGNLYFVSYSTVINSSGGDTLGQITLDAVTVPTSAVGTPVSPSATNNPVSTILNDGACSATPAPAVTFAAGPSSTASATASTSGKCASTLSGSSAFATTVTFTPSAGGADSIVLAATDQLKNTGAVTISGVGQAPLTTQSITFANPGMQTVGTPLTLAATDTSGLPITYTSATTSVCTVAGSTATFLIAGTCTIDANQPGNSSYSPAPQVQQSFTVTAAPSFTLAPAPGTLTVTQGSTAHDTITVTGADGFTGSVTLTASGLPSGVTASFATNPTTGSSLLTFTASSTATRGPASVTIMGTSGTLTASTSIALTVALPPSFTLTPTATKLSVTEGNSVTDTITVTPANGFTGSVTLAASGLPAGVSASFGTNPATGTSVLTLTASSAAATGPATVAVTGTSGTLTASTMIALTVSAPASFSLSSTHSAVSLIQGASATDTITINPANGFNGSVTLAATGLPTGVTAAFATNPATGSSVLTLTASSTAVTGPATVTVTGNSGTLTASTSINLTVSIPAGFTLAPAAATLSLAEGASGTDTITVTGSGGFSGAVTLAASNLPTGVTASFATNPTNSTSVLTLTASSTATIGSAKVTVTGTSGSLSASTTVTLSVTPAPTFTLTPTASAVSVSAGSSGTDTITVSGMGGFTGSVALSAAVTSSPAGAQYLPTVSFGATSPVTVSSSAGGSATLSISTTAPTSAAMFMPTRPGLPWGLGGGIASAGLLLLGLSSKRRRATGLKHPLTLMTAIAILFTLTFGISGCGGGSPAASSTGNPGTTPGTYTITVTAASGGTTSTVPITLTVE